MLGNKSNALQVTTVFGTVGFVMKAVCFSQLLQSHQLHRHEKTYL